MAVASLRWAPILASVRQQLGVAPWDSEAIRMIAPKISDAIAGALEAAVMAAVAATMGDTKAVASVTFDNLVERMEILRRVVEEEG